MQPRFKIGDRVWVTGLLQDFYLGETGTVVTVEANRDGIRDLDLYVIAIPGKEMHDTKLAGFELIPAGVPPKLAPLTFKQSKMGFSS
ncbi:MAG TPA: hypothetical protein VGK48_25230 [Terriglobia bacterium]|jgi:hypothetical protein